MNGLVTQLSQLMEDICENCKYADRAWTKTNKDVLKTAKEIASNCEDCEIREMLVGDKFPKASWQDLL